jgi:hypothetical protein
VRPTERLGVTVLALAFLAFHLPYLPASLEDLDSINFALGVRSFDVAAHRPHPPGYPVFIAAAKTARALIPSDATAIAALSVAAGTLGALGLFAFYRRVDGERREGERWVSVLAALLAVTAPLYWLTASRPLSDMTGLAAAIGVQALVLDVRRRGVPGIDRRRLSIASALAGVAVGIRSQVAWLTLPLLLFVIARDGGAARGRLAMRSALAVGVGALIWAVPLVAVSGGPAAYWNALFGQGAEDLANIQMLFTTPTLKVFRSALYFAFVAPWARWDVAVLVLVLAAAGCVQTWRRSSGELGVMAAAYVPYFAFDLLFQETFTTRYALPLVVPVAYFSARGALTIGVRPGVVVAIALAAFDAHVSGTSLAAYARESAPAFRLLRDMQAVGPAGRHAPAAALAADRRQALDLRRPIAWVGSTALPLSTVLPSPPKHEWLEAVDYLNRGAGGPLWFVVDPRRAQMALIDHGEPKRYRWSLPYPVLLGGVRPGEMDWYRVEQPEWYVAEGWSLTPEAAGIAREDGRGPGIAPIEGWIRRRREPIAIMIGGRNLDSALTARLTVGVDDRIVGQWQVPPGFFLKTIEVPAVTEDGDYAHIQVSADRESVAIEQFNAGGADRVLAGYGDGWQEQEYDATTGERWRWMSESGQLAVRSDGRALVLHLEGDAPGKYYARPSSLVVSTGNRVLLDTRVSAAFSLDVQIPADSGGWRDRAIAVQTDQVFVPAERSSRSTDRRHLGLRVLRCAIRPAS